MEIAIDGVYHLLVPDLVERDVGDSDSMASVLAAGFSTVVGIVFGTYPALRGAARPDQALRS